MRGIRVTGGHRSVVAGVHCLHHVEGFRAAAFADQNSVGAHAEGVDYEVALRDGTGSFYVHWAGFQAHYVRLLDL